MPALNVLSIHFQNGQEKPITYPSQKLTQAERKYAHADTEGSTCNLWSIQILTTASYFIGCKFCYSLYFIQHKCPRDGC